jgi:hypothetical protein
MMRRSRPWSASTDLPELRGRLGREDHAVEAAPLARVRRLRRSGRGF